MSAIFRPNCVHAGIISRWAAVWSSALANVRVEMGGAMN